MTPPESPAPAISLTLCDDCLRPAETAGVQQCPACGRPVCSQCQPDHRHSDGPANVLGQSGGN